ncbi:YnbE family lipoprotein [Phenylobacterium sp.]|uniref:YnbE family lipoprotein n=1 Tax=Phenylobacterium sp. TaxID=1871053 RepID=UPI00398336E0
MTAPPRSVATFGLLAVLGLSACAPTIRVEVAPITIYAKLDADVRLRLDEDVKALIQQNPNLF